MNLDEKEYALRKQIIEHCLYMNSSGLNQGTSGNISARFGDRMLITPSAVPYQDLTPEMLASMNLSNPEGEWQGPLKPSTEWRFHHAILNCRSDVHAVVHAHPAYCTAIAIARLDIPAVHYMIAAFGGNSIRCAAYATFGSSELSDNAVKALHGRKACLLANHGMLCVGENLDKAMWLAVELETLAQQYFNTLLLGKQTVLSDAQIDDTASRFAGYGHQ